MTSDSDSDDVPLIRKRRKSEHMLDGEGLGTKRERSVSVGNGEEDRRMGSGTDVLEKKRTEEGLQRKKVKKEEEEEDFEDQPRSVIRSTLVHGKKEDAGGSGVNGTVNRSSRGRKDVRIAESRKKQNGVGKDKAITKKPSKIQERKKTQTKGKSAQKGKKRKPRGVSQVAKVSKNERVKIRESDEEDDDGMRWWDADQGDEIKWSTLEHHGVLFPPAYKPHGVPLVYDGHEIFLDPVSEEVATFYAAKLETDYVQKATFRKNFFHDFQRVLKKAKEPLALKIKTLEKCDFKRIWDHLEAEKAKKKEIPPAEKKRIREEEQERIKKYTVAMVDGREEKVGNFRVEPPGLFLGRGEHPLAGKLKKRVKPEDITINIGKNVPVPPCPLDGHKWGRIIHNNKVTWLATWKDSITNGFKYVWLGAGSAFKGMSDHAKFEKARMLKDHIDKIRKEYTEGFDSKNRAVRQRSIALYLIDKLALRVGNEKGEDEADTVGCCSLRVEHVKFNDPQTVEFDFLGKDSIRYYNTVEIDRKAYVTMKTFIVGKKNEENIFDELTVSSLNDYLKELMPGLSAKVFRTYNASITLDRLLTSTTTKDTVVNKLVFYNQQNKEVAILCNHQRSLPKAHGAQMEKLSTKLNDAKKWLRELQRGLKDSKSKGGEAVTVIQLVRPKPVIKAEMNEKQRAEERQKAENSSPEKVERRMKREQLERNIAASKEKIVKLEAERQTKDDLKTVALGTSKINYLDPRITVAWCKRFEVPIEKVFAKTLLTKFAWAMETIESFKF
uniref:DNA topoisomerase I n=1 Tax=Compsopogon caeruleus TaxID=31354 RepID=A0A7S1TDG0_9RHOD|mmetsp:Transcript_17879/g.37131  ORF Transcript_17879/g.37131 Transcript_17879/m.37131 type:complete len:780 (+) Transcript_17879:2618-4957(+)|eukprot:CAMPEP_0184681032 /NCGR_PEP_ID=MMETSP0312-20130426/3982_1 /TAXON_ID=31354 /ORGANISM="Compsopogon coeruleus, Strain SAG 36.94" /LENGTH=779 /DNA_ID=CAMNT_0027131593 /DNA_START=105 /DNA_END=2444 /DNA_ORIENTATION=-